MISPFLANEIYNYNENITKISSTNCRNEETTTMNNP